MIRIGLLSDTHGVWDEKIKGHFKDCHEIWHAGDMGKMPEDWSFYEGKKFSGVYGNIDGTLCRQQYPVFQLLQREGLKIIMTHIAGYPGRYTPFAKKLISENQPNLFICGHSHILKIVKCPVWGHIHLNPGAAGREGFHQVRTLLRFTIHDARLRDMEVIHLN
jgi:predicted phosphodiesterase